MSDVTRNPVGLPKFPDFMPPRNRQTGIPLRSSKLRQVSPVHSWNELSIKGRRDRRPALLHAASDAALGRACLKNEIRAIKGSFMRRMGTVSKLPPLWFAALAACYPFSAQGAEPTDSALARRASTPRISFNKDVRAILSDRCFACHGPDENKREANLRLDTREGATTDLEGHAAIAPGRPTSSGLLERVASKDPDFMMPPPASNKPPLTAAEVETLTRWIEEGAEYQSHWSLLPMAREAPPVISDANQRRVFNPIDQFVLAAIEDHGLGSLAPVATKARLLRRVTLDLTGLPPTPGEIDAFQADDSPNAYEHVVDRLLASPRFGERMAAEWLDVARYADTHGYQMDRFRPMWVYRDWVIRSFNSNQPFNDFVRWQLAGDLLPDATKDQKLATAFNRLHSQNEEGGIVEEEFRVAYVVDRVNTFGTAFLGLTFECTRCHDHKYDPLTMRDFYSLFAFFQNIPEAGQTTYFTSAMPTPTLLLSSDEEDGRIAGLRRAMESKEEELARVRADARTAFEAWLDQRPSDIEPVGRIAGFSFETLDRGKLANAVDATKEGRSVEEPLLVEGPKGKAALLNGDNGFTFPGLGHFKRSQPFTLALDLMQPTRSPRATVLHHSKAPADAGHRGYDLLLENGHVAFGLYHMWPGNAVKVRSKLAIDPGTWTHVAVTHDGSGRASGIHIYIDGAPVETEVIRDSLSKDIVYEGGEPDLAIGHRFRDNGFKDGRVDDFFLFNRELTSLEVAKLSGKQPISQAWTTANELLDAATRDALWEYFLGSAHAPTAEARKQLEKARDEHWTLVHSIPEAMVMQELPNPKPAFILARGNYDQPTTPVSADTPHSLPAFPSIAPRNRLGLADWLLDPEHPLLARVTVNRYWQLFFGRGIVETADNFGSQGSAPTHPELLDWLARDFIDNGWDVQRLVKRIVLSATYRQDSKIPSTSLPRDPENLWLARAPARRLTAEMLRDQALFTSGLLVEKLGGPSVKPYQPAGLWNIAMGNPTYDQSHGPDLYRRSLYTFWKRTVPPPSLVTFDAADRSYCTVRRQSTSTPLQALVLLNDPQFVEAARFAGQRMLLEGGESLDTKVRWLFRTITGRAPTYKESSILRALFEEELASFEADEAAATRLLAVGEAPADAALDIKQLAAATLLAQAIFNHDEAVHER